MTDETANKVQHLIFKALMGNDLTGAQMVIEEIVKLERVDVLKEAIDRVEKGVADMEAFDMLMSMLEEEERR